MCSKTHHKQRPSVGPVLKPTTINPSSMHNIVKPKHWLGLWKEFRTRAANINYQLLYCYPLAECFATISAVTFKFLLSTSGTTGWCSPTRRLKTTHLLCWFPSLEQLPSRKRRRVDRRVWPANNKIPDKHCPQHTCTSQPFSTTAKHTHCWAVTC